MIFVKPGTYRERIYRAPWAKPLNATEAAKLTGQAVVGGADGWNPAGR